MAPRPRRARLERALRHVGALVGGSVAVVTAVVCAARFVPASEPTRIALALGLAPPLWAVAIAAAYLARRTTTVWVVVVAVGATFAGLAAALPR